MQQSDPPGLKKSSAATPEIPQELPGKAIAVKFPALENLPIRVAETLIGETEKSPTVRIERPAKSLRIDPNAPSVPPLSKLQKIACVVAPVTNWICRQVGVAKVTTKDGIDIPVEVNYDSEE